MQNAATEAKILQPRKLQVRNLKPDDVDLIGDRYLVEIVELDKSVDVDTDGGLVQIFLVGETEETGGWLAGCILRVGNGHRLERDEVHPMFLKVGDYVQMEKYSGRKMSIGGRPCVLINQTGILSKLNIKE